MKRSIGHMENFNGDEWTTEKIRKKKLNIILISLKYELYNFDHLYLK